jgi:hypothetical protein
LGGCDRRRFERVKSRRELDREQGIFRHSRWLAAVRLFRLVTVMSAFGGKADIDQHGAAVTHNAALKGRMLAAAQFILMFAALITFAHFSV